VASRLDWSLWALSRDCHRRAPPSPSTAAGGPPSCYGDLAGPEWEVRRERSQRRSEALEGLRWRQRLTRVNSPPSGPVRCPEGRLVGRLLPMSSHQAARVLSRAPRRCPGPVLPLGLLCECVHFGCSRPSQSRTCGRPSACAQPVPACFGCLWSPCWCG